jgi:hypothetical protein
MPVRRIIKAEPVKSKIFNGITGIIGVGKTYTTGNQNHQNQESNYKKIAMIIIQLTPPLVVVSYYI